MKENYVVYLINDYDNYHCNYQMIIINKTTTNIWIKL